MIDVDVGTEASGLYVLTSSNTAGSTTCQVLVNVGKYRASYNRFTADWQFPDWYLFFGTLVIFQ